MSRLPAAVVTEPHSLHIQIDADARLAAGVGGAARYLADAAGMENSKVAQLQSSVAAACVRVFQRLTKNQPHLQVALFRFADRIELALSHHGDSSPAVGFDSIAGFAAQPGGAEAGGNPFVGFDRIQYETRAGGTVTRLTKYIGKTPPGI